MQVILDWKNGMSFKGTAPGSGYSVDLSAEAEFGGAEDGFRSMELFALGLAGCTGMDVISILQKKRQEISAFEVKVTTKRAEEHPKIWTNVLIEYLVTGKNIDPAAIERAIELSHDKYCPAQGLLKKALQIEHRYEIKAA